MEKIRRPNRGNKGDINTEQSYVSKILEEKKKRLEARRRTNNRF